MTTYDVHLTLGHILRHAPAGNQGREAALVDIAQDLLLRHFHDVGLLDSLVFKGGTALRKLYAGTAGRFSLDLDFSVRTLSDDQEVVTELLVAEVEGLTLGPFRYGTTERRDKYSLTIDTDFGATGQLTSKLDVNPPPWLQPSSRPWVPMDIHKQYGGPLPELPCVRLEENVAEKIARLNRTTTARDVYDLAWLWDKYRDAGGQPIDEELVRRLAVLKIWVDAHGMSTEGAFWKPGHEAYDFDPQRWLRDRPADEFDREDIGELAVPAPDLNDLWHVVKTRFAFLTNLDSDEATVASIGQGDRTLVLEMVKTLPGTLLSSAVLW